ncbi:MAG: hypothetical protein V1870_00070 [Candidatus Aenigmatarchaeota archaeon]
MYDVRLYLDLVREGHDKRWISLGKYLEEIESTFVAYASAIRA